MSAKDGHDVGQAPVPTTVRRSSLPDAETTRVATGDPKDFRKRVDGINSEVEEKPKEEVKEAVFSRDDEPEIRGTIVITVFKNHPYEVELDGSITGSERDLAVKFLYKAYIAWKSKQAKQDEAKLKQKEKEDAGN